MKLLPFLLRCVCAGSGCRQARSQLVRREMAAVQMEREVIQLPPTAKHADTCNWFVRSYMALTSVSVFEHIFVVMICLNS